MLNRFLVRRRRREQANYHGTVSEKRAVKALGGRLTPGSGSQVSAKSDGYSPVYQYENKSTIHESFSIKRKVLSKVLKEARQVGRLPVLLISFVMGSGASKANGDFVVLRREDFIDLAESAYGSDWRFNK